MKRKATTGIVQRREVRNMVSHTFGWFKEFLAVPMKGKEKVKMRNMPLLYMVNVTAK